MRDLERFVKSVIGRKNSVDRFPLTVDCIVAVEFDHRLTRSNCFRRIYLDFVIVLAAAKDRNTDQSSERQPLAPTATPTSTFQPHACGLDRLRRLKVEIWSLATVHARIC